MHHWSSRKHYILDYLIIVGRQNIKTWPFSVEKSPKSPKSQKFKKTKVVDVGNMFPTGY